MLRSLLVLVAAALVCTELSSFGGEGPVPKEREPKTYTVSSKLTRKLMFSGRDGKANIDPIINKMPDVTTLEGTRGEYRSGGKLNETPYGFQLQFEVRPTGGDKVRFEVAVESSDSEAGLVKVFRSHGQRVVRNVRLGQTITLELNGNDRGEGILVELVVREAAE